MLSRLGLPRRRKAPNGPEPSGPLSLARAALGWERLWPALWPPAGVAGLFLALAWMGFFTALPPWLHLLFLLGFLGAIGYLGWKHLRHYRWPTVEEARRRVERDSALRHRPLVQLKDGLAGGAGDPLSHALWRAAQERARQQARALRVNSPHPNLAARDPWALRAVVGLLLVVGASLSWGDLSGRLGAALLPGIGFGGSGVRVQADAWLTPPDYTGQPPIFLTRPQGAGPAGQPQQAAATATPSEPAEPKPVPVPVNSVLLARVSGGSTAPVLAANGAEVPFEPVSGGGWQVSHPITAGDRVAITQSGREVGAWPIQVVPDLAPGITFRNPPAPTERQAVQFNYSAADDYGLAKVNAVIGLDPVHGEALPLTLGKDPVVLPLPLPGRNPKEANASGFHDLTPHPWAGLPVVVRLEALDGAGQVGKSADQRLVLPERAFRHPVARAVIAERKRLTLEGEAARPAVGNILDELSLRPDRFGGDTAVFLSLRSAARRLADVAVPLDLPDMQKQLWDTALRIEDGNLSLAERAMRDAQQKLMEALDRNASDEEINQLMQELEQAMQQFLDAMEEQMRQAMQDGQQPPQADPNAQALDRQDLQRMMEQMRQMAQNGSRDAARQMLSQLQQMMENLRNGQPQTAEQAQQNQQMQEMMENLQGLAQQQQQLMDETFRESQEGEGMPQGEEFMQPPQGQQGQSPNRQGRQPQVTGPQDPTQGTQGQRQQQQGQQQGQQGQMPGQNGQRGMAQRQEDLRRQLGELMRQFGEMGGEIPRPLGRAERSMRDAEQALQQGAPGQAVQPQGDALDQLQQGMQSMQQQMQAQQGQGGGGQRRQAGQQPGRDPLGRPLPGSGSYNTDDVKIPEEADIQRTREILDELRRRAGDPSRPKIERDYIQRLLDRFSR